MRRHREEEVLTGNLTAMIDVVFQLIIFFVATVSLQDSGIDERIKLAMAPHGKAVQQKDPREIIVDVDANGHVLIMRTYLDYNTLFSIMRKAVAENGSTVPVIIRGDGTCTHEEIRKVMDMCKKAGIWKLKFAALKEKG